MEFEKRRECIAKDLQGLIDIGDVGAKRALEQLEAGAFDDDIREMNDSPAKDHEISDLLIQKTRL